jgi:hypothetical protein
MTKPLNFRTQGDSFMTFLVLERKSIMSCCGSFLLLLVSADAGTLAASIVLLVLLAYLLVLLECLQVPLALLLVLLARLLVLLARLLVLLAPLLVLAPLHFC